MREGTIARLAETVAGAYLMAAGPVDQELEERVVRAAYDRAQVGSRQR